VQEKCTETANPTGQYGKLTGRCDCLFDLDNIVAFEEWYLAQNKSNPGDGQ